MSRSRWRLRRSTVPTLAIAATLLAALAGSPPAGAQTDRGTAARPSLLPLAQPLWSELSAAQRAILDPFESQWNALPLTEKRAWVELANRFPRMDGDEQRKVRRRIVRWAELTPEQRELARANFRLAQELPKDERVAEWESYQTMTPEQRQVLGTAGSTSNTAARHAGAPTGLAKRAAQPLPRPAIRRAATPAAAPMQQPAPEAASAAPAAGGPDGAGGDATRPPSASSGEQPYPAAQQNAVVQPPATATDASTPPTAVSGSAPAVAGAASAAHAADPAAPAGSPAAPAAPAAATTPAPAAAPPTTGQ